MVPMTEENNLTLVLGGTGKTGARVARKLTGLGLPVRRAARHGGDVRFAWDDPATHRTAVESADRVYLVGPIMRTRFAPQVSEFLDLAEVVGVRHVTYLSAYGIEFAPPEVALRAVELDLMGRSSLTHSILRPAWFMQNFSETFLMPVDDAIVVPAGRGGEAFVDVEDISVDGFPVRHRGPSWGDGSCGRSPRCGRIGGCFLGPGGVETDADVLLRTAPRLVGEVRHDRSVGVERIREGQSPGIEASGGDRVELGRVERELGEEEQEGDDADNGRERTVGGAVVAELVIDEARPDGDKSSKEDGA